jgi:hypothetical protein
VKPKNVSPSVAIILGKGPMKGPAPKGEAMEEEAEGGEYAAFGKAVREAMESKDDNALGLAIKDLVSYCQPEETGEDE